MNNADQFLTIILLLSMVFSLVCLPIAIIIIGCLLSGKSKETGTTPPNKDIWGAAGELPPRSPNKNIWG